MAQTVAELNVKVTAQLDDVKRQLGSLKGDLEKSSKDINKVAADMSSAFKAVGSAIVASGIAKFTKDFIVFAGELDSVSIAFGNLAKTAKGGSQGLLDAVRTATQGTVSDLEIMRTSNLALQLMGEDVADQLPQMAKIAAAAARTQGKSVQQMYNDIVVATGRQSVMILDNLGISSATASKLIEQYAQKLGKTRDQLTETEKKQAFFNAVMGAGNEILQKTNMQGRTLGESLQGLKATMTNLLSGVASSFTPGINNIVQNLDWLMQKIGDLQRLYTKFVVWYNEISAMLAITNREKIIALGRAIEAQKKLLGIEGQGTRTPQAAGAPTISEEAKKKYQTDLNQLTNLNSEYQKKILQQNKDVIGLLNKEEFDAYQKIKQVAYTSETEAQQARLNVAKYFAEERKKVEQQVNLAIAQNALQAMQGLTSQLGGVFNQYMTNKTIAIDNEQYREQERITAQYDAEKANIEATVFDEREKAEKLKALDEKRAREEKKLSEKIEKEKRKAAREGAIYQKGIGITQSIINTSLGVTNALATVPVPFNFALAALIGALGAAQTALIAAQPLPELAEGGLFTGPAIVAEKGREMALPLDGEEGRAAIREMSAGIVDTLATVESGAAQSMGGGNVYLDGVLVGQWINAELDNGMITVPARVVR